MWLTRQAQHKSLARVEELLPRCFVHRFKLSKLSDVDRNLWALMREAYAIGCQEHLQNRKKNAVGTPKKRARNR